MFLARVDDVNRALVVDLGVDRLRVIGPNGSCHVPHTVRACNDAVDGIRVGDVPLLVDDLRPLVRIQGLRRNVEGHDPFRASIHQHLH